MKANEQKAFAAMQLALYVQENNKGVPKNTVVRILLQAKKKFTRNNWQRQLPLQHEILALEAMISTLAVQRNKLK